MLRLRIIREQHVNFAIPVTNEIILQTELFMNVIFLSPPKRVFFISILQLKNKIQCYKKLDGPSFHPL